MNAAGFRKILKKHDKVRRCVHLHTRASVCIKLKEENESGREGGREGGRREETERRDRDMRQRGETERRDREERQRGENANCVCGCYTVDLLVCLERRCEYARQIFGNDQASKFSPKQSRRSEIFDFRN